MKKVCLFLFAFFCFSTNAASSIYNDRDTIKHGYLLGGNVLDGSDPRFPWMLLFLLFIITLIAVIIFTSLKTRRNVEIVKQARVNETKTGSGSLAVSLVTSYTVVNLDDQSRWAYRNDNAA